MKSLISKNGKKGIAITLIFSIIMCLVACGTVEEPVTLEDTSENIADESELKATDTAVVVYVDEENNEIILQTNSTNQRYEVNYDGTTEFYDKYGQSLSAVQIKPGDIVDIIVSIHSKTLQKVMINENSFERTGIESHTINLNKNMFSFGNENYKISEDVVVIMGDKVGDIKDINETDILSFKGIDRTIYSVSIDSGHGYLRLIGEEYFKGGWIEIGKIIKPITDDMLLLVPEGSYDMRVTYNGFGGNKHVSIKRDEETLIDISDLKGELLKSGKVSFTITPENATLYINGEKTDYYVPVELEYGVYQLDVVCKGYTSIRKYLSVGNENATISMTLEESDGSNDSDEIANSLSKSSSNGNDPNLIYNQGPRRTSSSSSSSSRSSSNTNPAINPLPQGSSSTSSEVITTTAQLYIDSPEGVEVYYDGSYKGVAPLSFTKQSGTHVITLRKEGYVTKSYTLTLGADNNDETYSFNMLIEE